MADDDLIRRIEATVCVDAWFAGTRGITPPSLMEALAALPAALPARGVGVPEIDGWVRRLRKTEEAGHVHHLSKADRLAIADFLAALAPTNAAQAREAALMEAWNAVYEAKTLFDAKNAIHALVGETRA